MITTLVILAMTLAQADSLPDATWDGYGESRQYGTVTGRVLDSRCHGPLAFANVLVVGTRWGAMSLEDGRYTLAGVSPGRHWIRAMMMGFTGSDTTVTVVADSTVTLDIVLDAMAGNRARPHRQHRPQGTQRCDVHGIDMEAVSVLVSYGLMVTDRDAEAAARGFPNAEPYGPDGGCGRGPGDPLMTWEYRCERCVQARNEWLNAGSWPLKFGDVPADWVECGIEDAIGFRAPAGMKLTVTDNECVITREWIGEGIRIKARFGAWPHVLPLRWADARGDVIGDVIVAETYVHIVLWNNDDGSRRLGAVFRAPPVGDSLLRIDIEVDDESLLETACAIVGSVRFVGE